jgi:DNA-binding NarL/FixJ family response regulator
LLLGILAAAIGTLTALDRVSGEETRIGKAFLERAGAQEHAPGVVAMDIAMNGIGATRRILAAPARKGLTISRPWSQCRRCLRLRWRLLRVRHYRQ